MKCLISKCILVLSVFLWVFTSSDAVAYDSMLEFESRSTTGGGLSYLKNIDNCFTTGKVIWAWEFGAFNNTCIPSILSKNTNSCITSSKGTQAIIAASLRGIAYGTMIKGGAITGIIALIAMGIEYIIMIDACTNAYIVAPHEYINLQQGNMQCEERGDAVVNTAPKHLRAVDVPFYYHCDPRYDPVGGKDGQEGSTLESGNTEDEAYIGRTWGYMGKASQYCAGDAEKNARKELVGKVVVHYLNGMSRFWSGMDNRCQKSGEGSPTRHEIILRAGETKHHGPAHWYAHYRFESSKGKVQLCVVTPYTLFPIRVGCSYVPPPGEELALDNFLKSYLKGTRCYYFITGRTDLNALGQTLRTTDENGTQKQYVKDFLSSDLHVISTVIGCIQDLLTKVFINPGETNVSNQKPFFLVVQERLKQIVYVVLILYVSLVGIKIITAAEVPQKGELIMYAIKFALVLYFATGSAWYEVKKGEQVGIYPALLSASSDIAGFFMGAHNSNDPVGFCKYQLTGANLFEAREIPISQAINNTSANTSETSQPADSNYILNGILEATQGCRNKVKITVWDLVDCKLLNYLNLGSCKYTVSGLMGIWFTSASFLTSIQGVVMAVASFIYCLMLLLIVFKFIHIFILAMFTLTILTLVSPIILCFALFDFTKGIFQKWMSMMLGYVLYPGLLFAFIALMLATFDAIFYGDLDVSKGQTIKEACLDVESVYCKTYAALHDNPCNISIGETNETLTESFDLGPFGTFTRLKKEYVALYFSAMLKLMLFAFLFYLFLGSVSEFLAILTGVQDLGGMAKGALNIATMLPSLSSVGKGSKGGGGDAKKSASGGKEGAGDVQRDGGGLGGAGDVGGAVAGSGAGGGDVGGAAAGSGAGGGAG